MTVVKSNEKAPFSIATKPKGRGGHYSFPGLLHYTFDAYLILLSVKQEVSNTIFKVFGMTWPGIEPRSPRPLANTLPTRQMNWYIDTNNNSKNIRNCNGTQPMHVTKKSKSRKKNDECNNSKNSRNPHNYYYYLSS